MNLQVTGVLYQNHNANVIVHKGLYRGSIWVAIKEQIHETVQSANEVINEAMIQSKLDHPSICKIYECFLESGSGSLKTTIVVELLSGDLWMEIKERAQSDRRYSEWEIWRFLYSLVSALSFAEAKGVSHGDIKPQNLFLSWDKQDIKIGDFGSSMQNLELSPSTQILRGTPAFLSPELRSKFLNGLSESGEEVPYDPIKADVFSLGMTFLYVTLLKMPQELCGYDTIGKIDLIVSGMAVSGQLQTVLKWMLAIDPQQRPRFSELEGYIRCLYQAPLVPSPVAAPVEETKQQEAHTVPVCQECSGSTNSKEIRKLTACGHSFHIICLIEFFRKSPQSKEMVFSCPYCRAPYKLAELGSDAERNFVSEAMQRCICCKHQSLSCEQKKCDHLRCPSCLSRDCKVCEEERVAENGF